MSCIDSESHVTLHYAVRAILDGAERDIVNTFAHRPATLQVGAGQLAPALEAKLTGLSAGDRIDFTFPPGAAYGERNPELVQTVSRAMFAANAEPNTDYLPGDVIEFNATHGRVGGVIRQMNAAAVTVDFNHPLAGVAVRFSAQVIGVL
jgi:FKBP-type peptidyl-prolyl cis-trans isomerase SlpA